MQLWLTGTALGCCPTDTISSPLSSSRKKSKNKAIFFPLVTVYIFLCKHELWHWQISSIKHNALFFFKIHAEFIPLIHLIKCNWAQLIYPIYNKCRLKALYKISKIKSYGEISWEVSSLRNSADRIKSSIYRIHPSCRGILATVDACMYFDNDFAAVIISTICHHTPGV